MSDEDISLDEKRVYADRAGTTTAFVATDAGVARVDVSDDIVGEFALEYRGPVTDVASADGRLAIATPGDVLVWADGAFVQTGFGPASAVAYHDGLVAAGDGRIARLADGRISDTDDGDDAEWRRLAELEDVRRIDGDLLAAASGVHRLDGTHVGLDAANDVTTAVGPLAATESGLFYLANGWMRALDGAFDVVSGAETGLSHAATDETLYERGDEGEDSGAIDWREVTLPVDEPIADVAYGEATYVLTTDGTFLANAGDGWRHRSLGLPGARCVAVR